MIDKKNNNFQKHIDSFGKTKLFKFKIVINQISEHQV